MARYSCPDGHPIIGTVETLIGCALIDGIDPDTQEPNHSGETTIYWDCQHTNQRDGKPLFQCDDGQEWVFAELVRDTDDQETE